MSRFKVKTLAIPYWYLPQSGAFPRAGQVPGDQYRRWPRDGQPAELWRGDAGYFYQAHPGGQSCWTERDSEDWGSNCRGKGTFCVTEQSI